MARPTDPRKSAAWQRRLQQFTASGMTVVCAHASSVIPRGRWTKRLVACTGTPSRRWWRHDGRCGAECGGQGEYADRHAIIRKREIGRAGLVDM